MITTLTPLARRFRLLVPLLGLLLATGCETNFDNPNSPTDAQVLNSREGLLALSVGTKSLYSVNGMRWLIETPAVTTREVGITTTFQNMIELEDGGSQLPNFNSNVAGLWSTMLRVVASADELIEGADRVALGEDTRNSIVALAQTLKAMSLGALAQHYEQIVVEPDIDNNAAFVSRQAGFEAAITALEAAQAALRGGDVTDEFQSVVLGGMDLPNTISAMLARFNLYAGNYEAAITAAGNVDLSVMSVFEYDLMNANPVWSRVFLNGAPNFKPRDNFGLPASFDLDDSDGRFDFYLVPLDENNLNGLPIEDLAGFFTGPTVSIPIYLPDEMRLIIAEAELRSDGDTEAALAQIDAVRTGSDAFGVDANTGSYDGEESVEALLEEVYLQRRLELFLTGQSLEDSRRFDRPEPSSAIQVFTDERNRNFYPYPERERNNNPNTPADPAI